MLDKIVFGNSKVLTIFDGHQVASGHFDVNHSPDVALLCSWERSLSGFSEIKPLVEKLLDSGCKYFLCVGAYSEALHDFIDDVFFDRSIENELDEKVVFVTTWHDADTNEDVAEFFVNVMSLDNTNLVAFLERGRPEDDNLRSALSEAI